MPDSYPIFGLSDESPAHLHTADDNLEAERWIRNYTRFGDWGGYSGIALYEMAPCETVDTLTQVDSPVIIMRPAEEDFAEAEMH
jgi:hypothetical protein